MVSLPAEQPFCERLNKYGGYTSNMRGSLSYKPAMDKTDNPWMLDALRDAYRLTTTRRDFIPSKLKSGKENFCHEIELQPSGFTHEKGPAKVDFRSVERVHKEKASAAYDHRAKITPVCVAPDPLMTETKEAFSSQLLNYGRPRSPIDRIIGQMESGFTRNTQPNPTNGRALDPFYAGQHPSYGKFGPSVTHYDYDRNHKKILTGKEPHEPFSSKTDKHSGYWQEKGLPPCFLYGTQKNICRPCEDYITSYRVHYPYRSCNKDYTGFTLTGKPLTRAGVNPDINLFGGKGYYLSETMERFTDIEKPRVQLYGAVNPVNTPGIFPKPAVCPDRPDCPDPRRSCKCEPSGPPLRQAAKPCMGCIS